MATEPKKEPKDDEKESEPKELTPAERKAAGLDLEAGDLDPSKPGRGLLESIDHWLWHEPFWKD